MQAGFNLVKCTFEQHGKAVQSIFNDAILNSTALYEYKVRSVETVAAWFLDKANKQLPVLGVENAEGCLLGFATYGAFRTLPAFQYTMEHSIYIQKQYRGLGIGRCLMQALIQSATQNHVHVLIGCVDANNVGSIGLHKRFGFQYSGTLKEVGFKFGRWLDLELYQLNLSLKRTSED